MCYRIGYNGSSKDSCNGNNGSQQGGQFMRQMFPLLLIAFCLASATSAAQSNVSSAKGHLERARSYSSIGDPRAEKEYKQAIAHRGGVYPEAWQGLSTYLAHALRLKRPPLLGGSISSKARRASRQVNQNT